MNYYLKKIGYAKRPEGFLISEVKENDCVFWESKSKVYFGTRPKDITSGDILIQEVSSSDARQNHAVIGVYKCNSNMTSVRTGPHTCEDEKNKWLFCIEVECLTLEFSRKAKNRLEQNRPMLLNLDLEWKRLGEKRLPYYSQGWAKITKEKAEQIIERIKRVDSNN